MLPLIRRVALSGIALAVLTAQPPPPPAWKEFSIGPPGRRLKSQVNNVRQGMLHTPSMSFRSLVGIAAGAPWVRILGPDWMDAQHYSVTAELSDETRLRLRTRSPEDPRIIEEFEALLTQELTRRFHLVFHRETRETAECLLRPVEGGPKALKPSATRERPRLTINNSALSGSTTLDGAGITYRAIGSWLQNHIESPVTVDESLPTGSYDFHLKWKSKEQASLVAALKEQLGLELATESHNLEYVVVDRVERPDTTAESDGEPPPVVTAPARDSSVTFDPAQLRRDLRILRQALEEGHPGLYRFTSKAELDRVFEAVSARLSHPMTALEFYRVLAPAVARIKCGHTALRPSRAIELRLDDERLIPVEVAILRGKVYVARDFSEGGIPAGAEIQTIDNAPISDILQSMLAVVHGDGDSATAGPYQLSRNRGFARQLSLISGLHAPFRVRYTFGGKTAETSLEGLPLKAMRQIESNLPTQPASNGNATFQMLDDGSTGVLKISSFEGSAEGGVEMGAFFERVFTDLNQRKARNLILDVRENGGGEDELGRRLFAYFADQPFRYYRDLVANALSFRFFQYVPGQDPLPPNVSDLVKPGPDHKYHVVGHPNWGIQQPAVPHFSGKAVVLMNGGSFSTTCEFLSTLHHRGGATFIGEETAGGYYGNTSGASAALVLPGSKLILPVQLVGYYMEIDGTEQGAHGIRPDHPVEYTIEDLLARRDNAMEAALRFVGTTGNAQ